MTTTTTRTNKFAGYCRACGGHVPAGAGTLHSDEGKWIVRHLDGQCPERGIEPTTQPVTEVGMYRHGEQIFKVQKSGTGNLYAKRLVQIGGRRLIDADESVVSFEFEYDRGAIFDLGAADRMTEDEAREFGIRYGICCVCATPLSDAKSVALGIGPVCRKRV